MGRCRIARMPMAIEQYGDALIEDNSEINSRGV